MSGGTLTIDEREPGQEFRVAYPEPSCPRITIRLDVTNLMRLKELIDDAISLGEARCQDMYSEGAPFACVVECVR